MEGRTEDVQTGAPANVEAVELHLRASTAAASLLISCAGADAPSRGHDGSAEGHDGPIALFDGRVIPAMPQLLGMRAQYELRRRGRAHELLRLLAAHGRLPPVLRAAARRPERQRNPGHPHRLAGPLGDVRPRDHRAQHGRQPDFLPSLYSHPIGYHGHALGPSINARNMDLSSPPSRESYLRDGAYRSIEFSATTAIPEYGGGTVTIPMEADGYLTSEGYQYFRPIRLSGTWCGKERVGATPRPLRRARDRHAAPATATPVTNSPPHAFCLLWVVGIRGALECPRDLLRCRKLLDSDQNDAGDS